MNKKQKKTLARIVLAAVLEMCIRDRFSPAAPPVIRCFSDSLENRGAEGAVPVSYTHLLFFSLLSK